MEKNTPSPATHLIIEGARQHNLKDVNVVLPKGKLIVFTGLSGSGKSSLAFDTIYAEGQRRYVESLSSYARQFLGIMQKPDVDRIDGLSPAISIDQKTTSHNPRSTVGTITEIYDYLRLLFARIGHPHCPQCGMEIAPQTIDQIAKNALDRIATASAGLPITRWFVLSPVVRDKKGEFSGLFKNLQKQGYQRVRVDGRIFPINNDLVLIKTNRHSIAAVVDRISVDKKTLNDPSLNAELESRLRRSLENALDVADGLAILTQVKDKSLDFPANPVDYEDHLFSQYLACPNCNISVSEIEPRLFSFNTPHGACITCSGLGTLLKIDPDKLIAADLTLSEGAIIPFAGTLSSDTWYARKVSAVVEQHGGDSKKIWKKLPEEIKQVLLYGDKQWYRVSGSNRQGREASFTFEFAGVVNDLERRYQETQSDFIRAEIERFMKKEVCPDCAGTRLKPEALSVTVLGKNIFDIVEMPINKSKDWAQTLKQIIHTDSNEKLTGSEKTIARGIVKEILSRLDFLVSVGLEYLNLHREAGTLAGGEAQRIRLASQIGTGLTGVLYVLDEPTIGLHPRDNDRLIKTLIHLRDLGNTVLVVEHDKSVMEASDYLVDFGPGAGLEGGRIVSLGAPTDVKADPASLTGKYLSGKLQVNEYTLAQKAKKLPLELTYSAHHVVKKSASLVLKGAKKHNLKNLNVEFPLGKLVVITGVSGSGKSTLLHDTLYPALKYSLHQKVDDLSGWKTLEGSEHITKVNMIDQSPIGRTPRSNPATYTKAFDAIRIIFAGTKEAEMRGYKPGRFSFNVKGGRCEACQGDGQVKISMQFLSDVYVTCEVCKGKRYNAETLHVKYKDQSIADVLDLTVNEAVNIFSHHSSLAKKLATLKAVGLGYVKLGQPAPTLSGGEAQRVKLAKELSTSSQGHTVYLLDEPTTGLHFEDVKNLLIVLQELVRQNNTVVVIEHNLDIIKNADWVIDLGPEGGELGGQLVAAGSPSEIVQSSKGYTAQYLRPELNLK